MPYSKIVKTSSPLSTINTPCDFFFFQAEDGIRAADVTGVQTCALPISLLSVLTRAASTITVILIFVLGTWLYTQGQASVGEIGRASCRERVEISVGVVALV